MIGDGDNALWTDAIQRVYTAIDARDSVAGAKAIDDGMKQALAFGEDADPQMINWWQRTLLDWNAAGLIVYDKPASTSWWWLLIGAALLARHKR